MRLLKALSREGVKSSHLARPVLVFDHPPYEEFQEFKPEFSTVKLVLLHYILPLYIPEKDLLCAPLKTASFPNPSPPA